MQRHVLRSSFTVHGCPASATAPISALPATVALSTKGIALTLITVPVALRQATAAAELLLHVHHQIHSCPEILLLAGPVVLLSMLFHHCARRHLLCPIAIAATLLSLFLDMFVLALFFLANTAQVLLAFLRQGLRPFSFTLPVAHPGPAHLLKCAPGFWQSNPGTHALAHTMPCLSARGTTQSVEGSSQSGLVPA